MVRNMKGLVSSSPTSSTKYWFSVPIAIAPLPFKPAQTTDGWQNHLNVYPGTPAKGDTPNG
jgi:hypothetical protein